MRTSMVNAAWGFVGVLVGAATCALVLRPPNGRYALAKPNAPGMIGVWRLDTRTGQVCGMFADKDGRWVDGAELKVAQAANKLKTTTQPPSTDEGSRGCPK